MAIIFRTSGAWGSGKGANLAPVEVDENFWELHQGLTALQTNPPEAISIESFTVTGDQMYVNMTDNSVMGPYTLPTAQWIARGDWQPNTSYAKYDVVSENGAAYLVMIDHVSAPSFDPDASAGPGQNYYVMILEQPGNVLPFGGTGGQVLAKIDDVDFNTMWTDPSGGGGASVPPGGTTGQILGKLSADDFDYDWIDAPSGGGSAGSTSYDVAFYYPGILSGAPSTLFQFVVPRDLTCHANLGVSTGYLQTAPVFGAGQNFNVYVDGTQISTLEFFQNGHYVAKDGPPSPITINAFSVITISGPTSVDDAAAGLSITLAFDEIVALTER